MLSVVRQAPERFGHEQARWTLSARRRSLPWLGVNSEAALLQVLRRLHIVRKRGQAPVHSPDPLYADKVAYHHHCRQQVQLDPERRVLVYLDEVGYERQPTLACDFEQRGKHVPLARLSTAANVVCRGVGALNALTGHVLYRQHARITTAHLKQFYAHLVDTYPHAEVIYVVQDNWPVHVHPQVLTLLQAQHSPFWPTVPAHWPAGSHRGAGSGPLPIQIVFLPTYSPWLNPIEKLWRLLKQQLIHLHRLSHSWTELKQRVLTFMTRFACGSPELLHYVGLLPY